MLTAVTLQENFSLSSEVSGKAITLKLVSKNH